MRFFLLVRTLAVWTLLAGAVVFFSARTLELWFDAEPRAGEAGDAGEQVARQRGRTRTPSPAPRRAVSRRSPPYGTYEVVAQRNLFSSDRREALPEPAAPARSVAPPRPLDGRFALFGIIAEGGRRRALVSNLDKKSAEERDDIWVSAGDVLGSLTILEVHAAEIVVSDGIGEHVVRLSDPGAWKQRGATRKARTRDRVQTIEIRQQGGAPGGSPDSGGAPAEVLRK